ncbi:MAG: HisA/HisF family protein [Methanobacteriaceae archaeon]|jgi:phosphoribosylformimino-5-aminoimidazole carboxamide ribotide isomerase|nr:HisA/HisF family protein [Methanobacteriaceae archaeon]
MINIIPVLDLKDSIAVSGKSGLRDTYQPLQTIYSSSQNPIIISNSLKLNGALEIYVADLDLIEKKGHNIDIIKMINQTNSLIFDGGIKNFNSFKFFLDFAYKLVVATETLESIDELYKIFNTFPKERIVISIDIKDDKILSNNLDLSKNEIKRILKELDPDEIILLDISRVGTKKEFNIDLLDEFIEFKDKLILGGGITSDQLNDLENKGIKKVLMGTAIHNGEVKIHPSF